MNNFVTDAINLKSYNLSENDKIILMYSKEKGLIKGVAKGCKKPKSKLGARMDCLIANTLMLYKGKNLDTICEAQAINTFKNSRQDLDKLFNSVYISEIVGNFGMENDPASEEIYNLLYKALEKISSAKDKKDILISVIKFQLKFMQLSGFGLELDTCLCCSKPVLEENMYFSSQKGGIICENCKKGEIKLHNKLRDFLTAMLQFDFDYESEYDKKATEKICNVCFELLKDYIQLHCPKKIKTTKIMHEIA
ncbi:MAG TPA: DNA repair protein RecO [Candidatus Gastranaerophilaceae bacterium]|nr:DNA repair protein RecO [Candidatus Gastranaerophilaceae bacterium]HPT41426.1 DNA repair protein RecO [Candidatus Gastranaerophilaceae bacterium]